MPSGLTHPFTGAVYENDGAGNIRVTTKDGRSGVFQVNGKWISGELRECDAQVCNWVGGPRATHHRLAAARQKA
jgi:hypothetical protein